MSPFLRLSIRRLRGSAGLAVFAFALLVTTGCPQKRDTPAGEQPPMPSVGTSATEAPRSGRTSALVLRVFDGGSMRVRLADHTEIVVLLAGVDSPRQGTRTRMANEPWGSKAQQALAVAAAWREVEIEPENIFSGSRDSVWAYLWLDGTLLNESMLSDGYAALRQHQETLKYADRLAAAEARAKERKYGLWAVGKEAAFSNRD